MFWTEKQFGLLKHQLSLIPPAIEYLQISIGKRRKYLRVENRFFIF